MARGFEWDRGRATWWLFGVALAGALLYVVHRFIGTFVFGVFLYYATRPVHRRVSRRIDQPNAAAATSLAIFLFPSFLLVGYTLAIAYNELQRLAGVAGELARRGEFSEYEELIGPYLEASELITQPQQLLSGGGVDVVSDILLTSVAYVGTVAIFALHVFVIVAIAFYLLRDDHRLSRWVTDRFADEQGVLDRYLTVVDKDFNNIFFGNILNAVLTGTIGAIVFSLLNVISPAGLAVPYAALVGLLTGVASLIPIVGMKLVYVPVALYLFAMPVVQGRPELTWFPIVFGAVSFVVVDTIPDLVLRPYVSGRSLHMGALMLAYVLGPLLFGWYGLFLAPMLLVLVVHFGRIVMPELIAGRPMRPFAVDPTYLAGGGVVDNPVTRQGSPPGGPADDGSEVTGGGEGSTEQTGDGEDTSGGDTDRPSSGDAAGGADDPNSPGTRTGDGSPEPD